MLSSLTDALDRYLPAETVAAPRGPATDRGATTSLRDALSRMPDPRHRRGVRYPFLDLLHIIVCAVLSGAATLTMIAEWAQETATVQGFPPGTRVPSLTTFHRVIAAVDAQALDTVINDWVRARTRQTNLCTDARQMVAVDGKEIRGAKNGGRRRVFLMAALDHATGCVIGQESIGEKTNEIPHFAALMGKIGDLGGVIVTADALHTQREHAEYLHQHGAHYVLTVKNNQRALRDRIASQTWVGRPIQHACHQKGHGRTTTWQATCQPAQEWIDFPHAAQTMRLTRDRHNHRTGERTREHVFVITSLPAEEPFRDSTTDTLYGILEVNRLTEGVRSAHAPARVVTFACTDRCALLAGVTLARRKPLDLRRGNHAGRRRRRGQPPTGSGLLFRRDEVVADQLPQTARCFHDSIDICNKKLCGVGQQVAVSCNRSASQSGSFLSCIP